MKKKIIIPLIIGLLGTLLFTGLMMAMKITIEF